MNKCGLAIVLCSLVFLLNCRRAPENEFTPLSQTKESSIEQQKKTSNEPDFSIRCLDTFTCEDILISPSSPEQYHILFSKRTSLEDAKASLDEELKAFKKTTLASGLTTYRRKMPGSSIAVGVGYASENDKSLPDLAFKNENTGVVKVAIAISVIK